jgi:hypothetical protein
VLKLDVSARQPPLSGGCSSFSACIVPQSQVAQAGRLSHPRYFTGTSMDQSEDSLIVGGSFGFQLILSP